MKPEKQNNKTAILGKLRESIMSEEIDSRGVEDLSKKVDNPNGAAELVKKIDKMIKNKKNNILMLAYHQGIIFRKFKENNKFVSAVTEFKINKTTISFTIDIVDFVDKYSRMRTSCISLHYLRNNFRVIKDVCKEHATEFQ